METASRNQVCLLSRRNWATPPMHIDWSTDPPPPSQKKNECNDHKVKLFREDNTQCSINFQTLAMKDRTLAHPTIIYWHGYEGHILNLNIVYSNFLKARHEDTAVCMFICEYLFPDININYIWANLWC